MARLDFTDDELLLTIGALDREVQRTNNFIQASTEEITAAWDHLDERRTLAAWHWYITARQLKAHRERAEALLRGAWAKVVHAVNEERTS